MDLVSLLSPALAPVQKQLFSYLEPADVLALSQTSKAAYAAAQDGVTSGSHNIYSRIKKFVPDPDAFRKVQGQCGALIGDEFALALFMNKPTPDCMTIYVGDQCAIVDYLVAASYQRCGFCYIKQSSGKKYLRVFLRGSKNFPGSPLYTLLRVAPTTARLNIVAWNKAYALYSRETLLEKKSFSLNNWYDNYRQSRESSRSEEWRKAVIWDSEYGINLPSNEFGGPEIRGDQLPVPGIRRVGDKRTWVIEFKTAGVAFDGDCPIHDSILESSMFELHESGKRNYDWDKWETMPFYGIQATENVLRSSLFKYPFVTPPDHGDVSTEELDIPSSELKKDLRQLKERMNFRTLVEFQKLPETKRPDDCKRRIYRNHYAAMEIGWGSSAVPEEWAYFDHGLVKALGKVWSKYEMALEKEKKKKRIAEKAMQLGKGRKGGQFNFKYRSYELGLELNRATSWKKVRILRARQQQQQMVRG